MKRGAIIALEQGEALMDRGPVALFGAIVAVGLGPALWLGAQFGRFEVTPPGPPVPVDRTHQADTQLMGGTGGGENETGSADNTPVRTKSRIRTAPVTARHSATPSSRPTDVTPSPSVEPSSPAVSPSATPSESSDPPGDGTGDTGGSGGSGGTGGTGGSGGTGDDSTPPSSPASDGAGSGPPGTDAGSASDAPGIDG